MYHFNNLRSEPVIVIRLLSPLFRTPHWFGAGVGILSVGVDSDDAGVAAGEGVGCENVELSEVPPPEFGLSLVLTISTKLQQISCELHVGILNEIRIGR